MNITLAKVLSYVFQPLAMLFLSVCLVFTIDPYFNAATHADVKQVIYLILGLNTFVVPTAMIVYLKKIKVIGSLDVEDRKQRFIPFAITLTLYGATYFLLKQSPLPYIVFVMLLAAIVAMVIAVFITLFWKISIHMTGLGGVVGTLMALAYNHHYFPSFTISCIIILAGLVGTARMSLKVHTLAQVICGFVLGFASQFLCVMTQYHL